MMTVLVVALLMQVAAPRPQPAAAERPVPSTGSGQTQPPAAPSGSPPTETYTYQPEGRRDPFLSLLGTGDSRGKGGEGVAGMTVGEISVRGVMQSRGAMVAMIQGPDNKTYIVHQGDKLLDGAIKSITMQGLVVDQQVSDPLSIVKHREVSKLLRSYEGAKE